MIFIDEFKEGDIIQGVYLCKTKTGAKTKAGKDYENLVIMDKTGHIDGKIWEPDSPGIMDFDANDFIMIKGQVVLYNKSLQFKIDTARKADPGEYIEGDYVPASRFNIDDMAAEFFEIISSVKNEYLNALLNVFFVKDAAFFEKFKVASAAKSVHHGFMGGLLEHTLSVARLCSKICENYDYINRDILITSALLHDIGKTKELSAFPQNDYTDEGNLVGHIVIGYGMIREKAEGISGFPEVLAREIEHCILSHHGQLEFGSPKKPATVEAYALAMADNMDAHFEIFRESFEIKNANNWLGFNKWLDSNIRRTEI